MTRLRRVLMVSPHFPPDSAAGAHRVRLLAPHLPACGWDPTVVTVDPRDLETVVDPELAEIVPPSLRIVRARAWPARVTRTVGFGDLGLRSLSGLLKTCTRLLETEHFDVFFVTIYPAYGALLGPVLKRRFGIPFVLDYQDPWVGSWGQDVGGGLNGTPDLRSRLSRRAAILLEPIAVGAADGVTAVSARTYEDVLARSPGSANVVVKTIPLGWEVRDAEHVRTARVANRFVRDDAGFTNLTYVGTLLPHGLEPMRALFEAVALLRDREPALYQQVRLWFVGTSNQFDESANNRVVPIAETYGVADVVREWPARIPYFEALSVLMHAHGILLLGSTEPHYTASKIYPALLAGRPLFALYHEKSSVVDILQRAMPEPAARIVTYGNEGPRTSECVECIAHHLSHLIGQPRRSVAADLTSIADLSAASLARRMADVFECVSLGRVVS